MPAEGAGGRPVSQAAASPQEPKSLISEGERVAVEGLVDLAVVPALLCIARNPVACSSWAVAWPAWRFAGIFGAASGAILSAPTGA